MVLRLSLPRWRTPQVLFLRSSTNAFSLRMKTFRSKMIKQRMANMCRLRVNVSSKSRGSLHLGPFKSIWAVLNHMRWLNSCEPTFSRFWQKLKDPRNGGTRLLPRVVFTSTVALSTLAACAIWFPCCNNYSWFRSLGTNSWRLSTTLLQTWKSIREIWLTTTC
jgi:hypothetical protein